MPKVSFYLRNEDLDKWKLIDKKTEWVHSNLNDIKPFRAQDLAEQVATVKAIIDKPDEPRAKTTLNWCKQHDMEKEYCRNMKHK